MKKIICIVAAAIGIVASAEMFSVNVGDKPASHGVGEIVGLKVVSTDADATVTLKRINTAVAYSNAQEVVTRYTTNVYTHAVTTNVFTNVYMAVKSRLVTTNAIASATCSGGFALTNFSALVDGDYIFADGTVVEGESVKATVIITR